jgi:DedD protein
VNGLKQRIIGALVLISLAVIFVPMLFDEPHTDRTSRVIDLPEEPDFPQVNVDPPKTQQQRQTESSPSYRLEEGATDEGDGASGAMTSTVTSESVPTTNGQTAARDKSTSTSAPAESSPEPVQPPTQSEPKTTTDTATVGAPDSGSEVPESAPKEEAEEFGESLKGAWLVQLGSFGNNDNAQRLRDNVRELGYAAHTQSIKRGDKTLTRVFSGPYADKAKATDAKQALDKAFSVNSLVMTGDK